MTDKTDLRRAARAKIAFIKRSVDLFPFIAPRMKEVETTINKNISINDLSRIALILKDLKDCLEEPFPKTHEVYELLDCLNDSLIKI